MLYFSFVIGYLFLRALANGPPFPEKKHQSLMQKSLNPAPLPVAERDSV